MRACYPPVVLRYLAFSRAPPLYLNALCRYVFKRTGRDLKTCVQLIRQGNKQLFLSSVERFQQLHADAQKQLRLAEVGP